MQNEGFRCKIQNLFINHTATKIRVMIKPAIKHKIPNRTRIRVIIRGKFGIEYDKTNGVIIDANPTIIRAIPVPVPVSFMTPKSKDALAMI